MRRFLAVCAAALLLLCVGCGTAREAPEGSVPPVSSNSSAPEDSGAAEETEKNLPESPAESRSGEEQEETAMKMKVEAGGSIFWAVLEENAAAQRLVELMREAPVTVHMSDYAGFEKVGPLGQSLPADNSQTTTHAGDIVLYNGNQIVIFYGSNAWSYTRLGKIDGLSGWEEALGSGDVTVTFSLEDGNL